MRTSGREIEIADGDAGQARPRQPSACARRSTAARTCLALAACAATWMGTPAAARASTAPSNDAAVYVSDQFKAVAKKAFRQFVGSQIVNACPPEQPICKPVLGRLAEAFDAALTGDDPGLQQALKGFLRDAALGVVLDVGLGDLLRQTKGNAALGALRPMVECVAAGFTGKLLPEQCRLNADEVEKLAPKAAFVGRKDQQNFEQLVQDLKASRRPDVGLVLDVMAGVASLPTVDRPDYRIYALRLARLWRHGFRESAFEAVYRFLAEETDAADQRMIAARSEIFDPASVTRWIGAIKTCGQPLKPIEDFKRAVEGGAGVVCTEANTSWILSHWVLTPAAAKEVTPLLDKVVKSGALVSGVAYSAALAVFYLPARLLLGLAASQLAEKEGKTQAERQKWMTDNDMGSTWRDSVTQLFALLAPVISGSLFESLTKLR